MKRVLVISNYAPSLINFRGHLLKDFIRLNYNVITCAPENDREIVDKLKLIGAKYYCIPLERNRISPIKDFLYCLRLLSIIKTERPNLVLSYTIKPVIWGATVAYMLGVRHIYSIITGIGYSFYLDTTHQRFSGIFVKILYKLALNFNSKILFQNTDDKRLFLKLGLVNSDKESIVINGSGVDLIHYSYKRPYNNKISFITIARLIREKGILEYYEAASIIKDKYPDAHFRLIGWWDPGPSSINKKLLNVIKSSNVIDFIPFQIDVRPYIWKSSVFVLPSYREGTPRTVLEAMSMGRPIITTNSPGCKETVKSGINGLLVPIKNSKALADAMEYFILNPKSIVNMGIESRKLAVNKYDVNKVNKKILDNIIISEKNY